MKLKTTTEEIDKQTELPSVCVSITDYDVEVLDPKTPMMEKIALAARTCYRSESVASTENDKKLIAGCVKRGHTSVLEHGAISLYLDIRPTEESAKMIKEVIGQKGRPVALRQLWDRMSTLTSQRYATSFNDPDIFAKHYDEIVIDGRKLPKEADVSLPVIIANLRAWRDIISERIFISENVQGDPISWLLTVAVLYRMCNVASCVFDDLVDSVIARIKTFKELRVHMSEEDLKHLNPIESLLLNRLTDEEIDNFCLAKFLEKFFGTDFKSVIAEESSPSTTVTIVLTTDRAVTHEHVRHRRSVGYSQESQRYVNYEKKGYEVLPLTCDPAKAPEGVEVDPFSGIVAKDEVASLIYEKTVLQSFAAYEKLLSLGFPPESARKVLPNGCRTKIVVTWLLPLGFTNFIYWRTESHAQYDIRLAADKILLKMFEMNHPFLAVMHTPDLIRSINWMKEQKIFDDATMSRIDRYLEDRKTVEAELRRQAEEEHRIMEERQLEEAKRLAAKGGVIVDDHATKKMPSSEKPPAIIKVGGNGASAPEEPVSERPATIQFETQPEGGSPGQETGSDS